MATHRILVVDDNRDLAENVAEILEDAGFAVDVFEDPFVALEKLVPGAYAVALLDIKMPGMDGIELYKALKKRDPALPAIAMTAYAQDDRIRAAVDEGVIAVMPKPLDVTRLLRKLGSVVEGEKALVIEDDVDLAQNLVEILTERGFSVRAAHSCAEARRLGSSLQDLSVLLVDCRLPDGDGLELVDELCRGTECTAVIFSGFLRALPASAMKGCGNLHFFEKPLDIARLIATLRPAK
ncbi:response regulator [Vulgatibacter sp.]|uniref:response regulator n=1 Tax=Vulgatibacter sp. TaxID=1971226 RepID=UPI003569DC99